MRYFSLVGLYDVVYMTINHDMQTTFAEMKFGDEGCL